MIKKIKKYIIQLDIIITIGNRKELQNYIGKN
jgi:hypothetical protein